MKRAARFVVFCLALVLLFQVSPRPAQAEYREPIDLAALVAEAESEDGRAYTNASWQLVQDALSAAHLLLEYPASEQEALDTAYHVLRYALGTLVPIAAFGNPFSDVQNSHWFYNAVLYAYANGLIQGDGAGQFLPGMVVTRAMMVTLLYHLQSAPVDIDNAPQFDDVSPGTWYYDAVSWAAGQGIVSGLGDGFFAPARGITRQEMAVLLHQYALFAGYDTTVPAEIGLDFSDFNQISPWATDGIRWALYKQLVRGYAGRFMPGSTATRAESATLLQNFVDRFTFGRLPLTDGASPNRHYISWAFSVYEEPCHRARRIVTFGPQAVEILREANDGWALIATYRGPYWVYLPANLRFIDHITGLYEHRGAPAPVSPMGPQLVTILQQEGQWLQIATWQGPRWIRLDFTPPTAELDRLLNRWGNSVSVYFANIETGFVFQHNPDRIYHGASVPKAFFSMYIYQKADRGQTNLDTRHRFPRGGTLTQREMLRRNLMYSCNDSTIGLRDVHGTVGYRQWVAALGNNPDWVSNSIMGSRLNLAESSRFAWAIWHYIESDAQHAAEFKRHLLNNQFPFIVSDYPIASKTGWTSTVFHDMAIVYADSPYILIILSQRANHAIFREISMAFQRFNDMWF